MTDSPFDWSKYLNLEQKTRADFITNDEYEAYQEKIVIVNEVFNYEFADKDVNGEIDDEKNRELMESLTLNMKFYGYSEITVKMESLPIGSHRHKDFIGGSINIDFEQLRSRFSVINYDTGLITPSSVNSIAVHELDHCFDKDKTELIRSFLENGDQKDVEEYIALKKQDMKLADQITGMGIVNKEDAERFSERQQLVSQVQEIFPRIRDLEEVIRISAGISEEQFASLNLNKSEYRESRYENENESVAAESVIAEKHGESVRSSYVFGLGYVYPPLNSEQPVHYTSDEQKMSDSYTPRKVTEAEVRNLYLEVKGRDFDTETKGKWLEELRHLHQNLFVNDLYETEEKQKEVIIQVGSGIDEYNYDGYIKNLIEDSFFLDQPAQGIFKGARGSIDKSIKDLDLGVIDVKYAGNFNDVAMPNATYGIKLPIELS